MRRLIVSAAAAVTLAGLVPAAQALSSGTPVALVPCSPAATAAPGGDWPAAGGDAQGTRYQPAETGATGISAATIGTLAPAWAVKVDTGGNEGNINGTPVEADGCVFVGTANGNVVALAAGDGHEIWRTRYDIPSAEQGLGGTIVGSTVVGAGRVYVLVNAVADSSSTKGPFLVALDEQNGRELWRSAPLSTWTGSYTNATPTYIPSSDGSNPVVLAGWSPAEGDPYGQGGFAVIDAVTGRTVKTTDTIPVADQAAPGVDTTQPGNEHKVYAGGGIWSSPAYDPETGYAYVGASNPYSKQYEHPNTNAVLKIDLHRNNQTYGGIVASYKGYPDQYLQELQALSQSPACAASDQPSAPVAVYQFDDPVCGQIDLDFGAPVNIFTTRIGTTTTKVVGALQKAGVYHVFNADTMAPITTTLVGGPCQPCNAAATAVSPTTIGGVGVPGSVAFGLNRNTAATVWQSPLGDGTHYEGTSMANGLMYTTDNAGFLDVFDEATGAIVLKRQMAQDLGVPWLGLTSAGLSIARHSVFVAVSTLSSASPGADDGWVVAYRTAPATIGG